MTRHYLSKPKTLLAISILAALVGVASIASAASTRSLGSQAEEISEAGQGSDEGEQAAYEGRIIDLARNWGGASACLVAPDLLSSTECFSSEGELEQRVTELESQFGAAAPTSIGSTGSTTASSSSGCGSFLKLYDGAWYNGQTIWFSTRLSWLNLSSYGFNQKTSSFRIGSCSAYFADYSWGGGAWYPTYLTQANDNGPTMLPGWNNDVSSLYIK